MEQEAAVGLERDKKLLEAQVKDAQNRVDEAEQNALKGGKKAMAKMETRIRELESEMDAENRRCTDAQKVLIFFCMICVTENKLICFVEPAQV